MFCESWCGIVISVLSFIIVVLGLHYVYLLWNSDYWKKRGVFCPNSKLLFGNLPSQVSGKRNIVYEFDEFYKEFKDQYAYIGLYNFRQPRLLLLDPNVIKDILIKHFKNFQGTELYGKIDKFSDPLFGNHPFLLIGDEWKTKRAEISPAFTNTRIKAIFPIGLEVIAKMIDYIKQENEKDDFDGFDAKDLAARFTISVVSNSIYNVDPKSFEGQESEILKQSQVFTVPSKRFMITSMITTMYPFMSKYLKLSFSQPGAQKFFYELMDKAMKHREESKFQSTDYLDYLSTLKKKKEISDADIATHGASFLIDGFDTSSSAISAALKELGENQDVQDKLREEINNAMPTDEEFTYDKIMNLQYMDQVWNETLRMHDPATHLTRMCTGKVEVDMPKDKKLMFDKNLIIFIPVMAIHMDPEFYPEPKKFNPDRFAPENGGVKSFIERGVFLPFGTGPRMCVGNRFAIAQSKIAIAAIVKNFKISINPKSPKEYVIHPQAIISTLLGCVINLKEIKRS